MPMPPSLESNAKLEPRRNPLTYVLITPAKNEERNIRRVIESVIAQTLLPIKWVIVDDGSSDNTGAIVSEYAACHPFIELLTRPQRKERNFGGKAEALNSAYARLQHLTFEVVGTLDADMSFSPGYFSYLLERFWENPRLGVAGTPFTENGKFLYDYRFMSTDHVSGACQMFRRACFDQLGGYVPVKGGGIDLIAVISARMHGWDTRSFSGETATHHRTMGTASHNPLMVKYRTGVQDYNMGGHPVWEIFRAIYQMAQQPFVLGGILIFAGYYGAMLRRLPRPVANDFIKFRRREQLSRLRKLLRFGKGTAPATALPSNYVLNNK